MNAQQKKMLETQYIKNIDDAFGIYKVNSTIALTMNEAQSYGLFFPEFYQSIFLRIIKREHDISHFVINHNVFCLTKEEVENIYNGTLLHRFSEFNTNNDVDYFNDCFKNEVEKLTKYILISTQVIEAIENRLNFAESTQDTFKILKASILNNNLENKLEEKSKNNVKKLKV